MSLIAIAGFTLAALLGITRLMRGPSLADRIVALDVTIVCLMGAIAVDAARRDDPSNLALLIVLSIIGFTATAAATRFLQLDGERKQRSSS